MYTLIWNAKEDSYEIEQDGELYHLGIISTDFSDFKSSQGDTLQKTPSHISNMQELTKLREQIEQIPEYLEEQQEDDEESG